MDVLRQLIEAREPGGEGFKCGMITADMLRDYKVIVTNIVLLMWPIHSQR